MTSNLAPKSPRSEVDHVVEDYSMSELEKDIEQCLG